MPAPRCAAVMPTALHLPRNSAAGSPARILMPHALQLREGRCRSIDACNLGAGWLLYRGWLAGFIAAQTVASHTAWSLVRMPLPWRHCAQVPGALIRPAMAPAQRSWPPVRVCSADGVRHGHGEHVIEQMTRTANREPTCWVRVAQPCVNPKGRAMMALAF